MSFLRYALLGLQLLNIRSECGFQHFCIFHPPIIDDRNVKNCIIYSDCLIYHCQAVLVRITVIPSTKLSVTGCLMLVRWIAEIQQHMLLLGLEERFENGCYGLSYLGVCS